MVIRGIYLRHRFGLLADVQKARLWLEGGAQQSQVRFGSKERFGVSAWSLELEPLLHGWGCQDFVAAGVP